MLDSTSAASGDRSPASSLDVRLSRFSEWYYFDIRHEDQRTWSAEISAHAERSIASAMATIAIGYNSAAKTDVPILFVTSISPDVTIDRDDVVDMSEVYADVCESVSDARMGASRYAVYATKHASSLARLIEVFGVFGMVFPLGIQANLWLQIGVNSWDFVLNDRAAECLPDHVVAAFAGERLNLIPTSPEPFVHRKVYAERTVADFTRPHPVRFKP